MYCKEPTIQGRRAYNFIGIKQKETNFEASTIMRFKPNLDGEEAGLCLIQKDDNYLLFDVKREDEENVLRLVIKNKKNNPILKKDLVMGKKYKNYIELKVIAKDNIYQYYFRYQSNDLWELFDTTNSDILLTEGYTGTHLGLYATSNRSKSINFATFDVFKLEYSYPPLKLKK
jgi:alpha-N-arabinofuranosidase